MPRVSPGAGNGDPHTAKTSPPPPADIRPAPARPMQPQNTERRTVTPPMETLPLRARLVALEVRLDEVRALNIRLEAERNSDAELTGKLLARVAEVDAIVARADKQERAADARAMQAEAHARELAAQLAAVEKDVVEARQHIDLLQLLHREDSASKDIAVERVNSLQREIAALRTVADDVDSVRNQRRAAVAELEQRKDEVAELRRLVEELKARNTEVEQQSAEAVLAASDEAQALRAEIAALKTVADEVDDSRTQRSVASAELEQRASEVADLRRIVDGLKTRTSELEAQAIDDLADLARSKTDFDHAAEALAALAKSKSALEAQATEAAALLAKTKAEAEARHAESLANHERGVASLRAMHSRAVLTLDAALTKSREESAAKALANQNATRNLAEAAKREAAAIAAQAQLAEAVRALASRLDETVKALNVLVAPPRSASVPASSAPLADDDGPELIDGDD